MRLGRIDGRHLFLYFHFVSEELQLAQLALAFAGAAIGNAALPGVGFAAFGFDIPKFGAAVGWLAGPALGATLTATSKGEQVNDSDKATPCAAGDGRP